MLSLLPGRVGKKDVATTELAEAKEVGPQAAPAWQGFLRCALSPHPTPAAPQRNTIIIPRRPRLIVPGLTAPTLAPCHGMHSFARARKYGSSSLQRGASEEDIAKYSKRTVRVTREQNAECKRLLQLLGMPIVDVSSCPNHLLTTVCDASQQSQL